MAEESAPAKTHPPTWIAEHGKQYEQMPEMCMACHGQEMDGGIAGLPCNICHLLPKHPPGWKQDHGPLFLKDKSQCTMCHTKRPFSGVKRPWAMNCTRCHSNNKDPSRWQLESHTSQLYVNAYNSGMIHEDRFGAKNFRTDQYVGVNYSERSRQVTVSSQARLSREWLRGAQNLDLYEAAIQFDNLFKDRVNLTLGRQPFLSNVDYYLVDGVNAVVRPARWFDVGLYAGIPRRIELEDLGGDTGLVTGMNLSLKETKSYTSARIGFSYDKRSLDGGGWNAMDKMYLSGSFSQGISIFKLYGLGEYDLTGELPQTATVGAEIYPFHKKIGFLAEGGYYNESRDDRIESVFTFFSIGRLLQAKGGVFFNPVKNLNITQNFAYQSYDVSEGEGRTGLNSETGVNYYADVLRLDAGASYFFIKSYGGLLHGVRLNLYENWSPRLSSGLLLDYVTYEKITNDDNNGLSAGVTGGFEILPGLKLAGTFEYITNDVFASDLRGLVYLNYIYGKRFLEFDKKKAAKTAEPKK